MDLKTLGRRSAVVFGLVWVAGCVEPGNDETSTDGSDAATMSGAGVEASAGGDEGESSAAGSTSGDGETSSAEVTSTDGGTSGVDGTSSSDDASSSDATSTTGPGSGCTSAPLREVDPPACSVAADVVVQLEIQNDCAGPVELFWVGYDCIEVPYQVIAGGEVGMNETFVTHPWRIRDAANGELLVEIPALEGDAVIVIE